MVGKYIPLLYLEAMIFPSIYWKASDDNCSIVGAIPSSLMNEAIKQYGFVTIQHHIRTRLTSNSSSTSTYIRYTSYCFDVISHLSASYNGTIMMINRGLTVDDDKEGGLGVRGKGDS